MIILFDVLPFKSDLKSGSLSIARFGICISRRNCSCLSLLNFNQVLPRPTSPSMRCVALSDLTNIMTWYVLAPFPLRISPISSYSALASANTTYISNGARNSLPKTLDNAQTNIPNVTLPTERLHLLGISMCSYCVLFDFILITMESGRSCISP